MLKMKGAIMTIGHSLVISYRELNIDSSHQRTYQEVLAIVT